MSTKAKILYVDDELDNLTVFKIAFRRYFDIYTSSTAAEGFRILETEGIQVVVTDQRMPEMTGVEFLSQIPDEPFVVRIILTAYTESQAIIDAVNKGKIFRYINKPWKLEDLKQTLDNAVEHHRLTQSNQQLLLDLKASNEQLADANKELTTLNKQLYSLDKAKSEFLNIISHEIKTPLNGIIGLTRLLSLQIEEEEYREFFTALKLSVDRLDEFAKNAIFLTQLETQTYRVTQQRQTVSEIINAAIQSLRSKTIEKKLAISIESTPAKIELVTDGLLLQRCLVVVIDNAIRYSPANGEIRIEANYSNKQLSLCVCDDGPGFSEQAIGSLFKYFGIGEAHYDQHVGLGLSLVNMAMSQLNGEVSVVNQPNTGAKVTLNLSSWE